MWMFKTRNLSLHQKVILINCYISSRLWFMASIISIPNSIVAKITSRIGSFLWDRYPTRVPMYQLALPINKGGLNLHLPANKTKALLANRYLQTSGSMPFARSLSNNLVNPPNINGIPTSYCCLKILVKIIPYLPEPVKNSPTSLKIHSYFREMLPTPKIAADNPTVCWTRIWKVIGDKFFTTYERSQMYLFVNRKIPNRALLFRQNRTDSPNCMLCPNNIDDLEHKLTSCIRTSILWNHIKGKLDTILGNRITFEYLLMPIFQNVSISNRRKVLRLFICYVNFVLNNNNTFTVEALDFVLSCLNV